MKKHRRFCLVVAACFLSTACSRETGIDDWGGAIRDSAGIEIVENVQPAWRDAEAWRLADVPSFDVGGQVGEPEYELFNPRMATQLSDGRIAVANSGAGEIRYYDPSGSHLVTVGGEGGGPGEFQNLSWIVRLLDDSLAAYDRFRRRITVFDPAGQHVRDVFLARTDRLFFPSLVGTVSENRYLATLLTRQRGNELPTGLIRDSVASLMIGADGEILDTLAWFPDLLRDVQMRSIGERRLRLPATLPFSPRMVMAVGEDQLFAASSDAYEVGVYDLSGRIRRLIRKIHEPIPVTNDDRDALVASELARFPGGMNNIEVRYYITTLRESPLPEVFPVLDSVLVDAGGNLWVSEYRKIGDDLPRWMVFDSGGRWLGEVLVPRRFRVSEVGRDYVLGIWTDEDEVEHVQRYALEKQ